mgnify:CR=1 FL=1
MAILPTMALAACGTDEGAEAEKRYEMVKRTGTKGELCAAGRDVADTNLRLAQEDKYREWHTLSGMECQLADLTSPSLPATESPTYKAARAEAEADAEMMDKAARQAIEGHEDEKLAATRATEEPEPE